MFRVYFHLNGVYSYLDVGASNTYEAQMQVLTAHPTAVLNTLTSILVPTSTQPCILPSLEPLPAPPKAEVIRVDFVSRKRVIFV